MEEQLVKNIFWDLFLIMLFTIPHTALLFTKGRLLAKKIVPHNMFNTLYSIVASCTLLFMFYFWRPIPFVIYKMQGHFYFIFFFLYIASWIYMVWAQVSTDFFAHIGIKQWWDTIHGRRTLSHIPMGGAYKISRHPIFLAFFGMIWFSPTMTVGHLMLSVVWSLYLIIGTLRKENNLMKNKIYRNYAAKVPAYPFLPKHKFSDIISFQGIKPMNHIFKMFLIFPLLLTINLLAKIPNKRLEKTTELISAKNFESFSEAEKAYEGELIPLSEGLSFSVVSTKIGIFSSSVLGLVKKYEIHGILNKDSISDMSVVFPIDSMDTDSEGRDKKLHNLCLGTPDFSEIKITIKGPLNISLSESDQSLETDGIINIRGKDKNIKVKMKIYKSALNNESWLRSEGEALLSVKDLEIPDPSIAVATLSDEIEVKFKLNIPLKEN